MRWLYNSRFDENIEVIDDSGRIVATCTHSCAIFAAQRGRWGSACERTLVASVTPEISY